MKLKKLFSALLAFIMIFALFTPMLASAVCGNPVSVNMITIDVTYRLNADANPLTVAFQYSFGKDCHYIIDESAPITLKWYSSDDGSTANRNKALKEETFSYPESSIFQSWYEVSTDKCVATYYYAVLSYTLKSAIPTETLPPIHEEAVSDVIRFEVFDPTIMHDFRVKTVDETGKPLAGAVIVLVPDARYVQDRSAKTYTAATDWDGFAHFSVPVGYYVICEKLPPKGYNPAIKASAVLVSANGVYLFHTINTYPHELVTFVNKKIPGLNKEDHFAYIEGYPDGTFDPDGYMTRAEAVSMFSRLLSERMDSSKDYRNGYYEDVEPEAWYANQVGYMQSIGILDRYSSDSALIPDVPVLRGDFVTLASYFDDPVIIDINEFSDLISDWTEAYISSAVEKGWVQGYPDGTFKSEERITRAEAVTIVNRILERRADKDYLEAQTDSLPRSYADLTSAHWAYLNIMEASVGHDYTKDNSREHWTATDK